MRIIYDDAQAQACVAALRTFMDKLSPVEVCRMDYGINRVQDDMVWEKLNAFLSYRYYMSIGKQAEHYQGIGNNNKYPVYYSPEKEKEIQICCYVEINTGLYGEGFVYLSDYDGNRISPTYTLTARAKTVKG